MNIVVDIVKSWAASDSSVNPTKEILEWVRQRNETVKVRIDKTDFEKDGFGTTMRKKAVSVTGITAFFPFADIRDLKKEK